MTSTSHPTTARWRPLVGAAGLLTFLGGPLHPDSSDTAPLQERMATMTADTVPWVIGHGLMTIGSALLVVALLVARRSGAWPPAAGVLPFAVVATVVNTFELVLHTAAVLDHDALARGDWPPLSVTHLAASVVSYPLFGVAVILLAWRLMATWPGPLRPFAVVGILGGLANAAATPLAVLFDVDGASALFPLAAIGISAWLVAVALIGIRATDRVRPDLEPATTRG